MARNEVIQVLVEILDYGKINSIFQELITIREPGASLRWTLMAGSSYDNSRRSMKKYPTLSTTKQRLGSHSRLYTAPRVVPKY